MGRPFEPNYISLDANSNNFVDVKGYLYSQRVYTSSSSYPVSYTHLTLPTKRIV